MAIKFASSNLTTPQMNVFSLNNFNGVDYTTTPTLVDNSRGIDMSNYMPLGNSLVKRNGWNAINSFTYNGSTLKVYNIWKFKNYYNKDELSNTKYIIFAGYGENEQVAKTQLALYEVNSLIEANEEYSINKIFPTSGYISSELYSYGVLFENRLFILAMNKYLMLWYEKDEENSTEEKTIYNLNIDEVKNHAFIPQVIAGLGHKDGQESAVKLNDFNLLKDECYIEIVNYKQETEEKEYIYDIGQFFTDKFKDIELYKVNGIELSNLNTPINENITFGKNGNYKENFINVNLSEATFIDSEEGNNSSFANGNIYITMPKGATLTVYCGETNFTVLVDGTEKETVTTGYYTYTAEKYEIITLKSNSSEETPNYFWSFSVIADNPPYVFENNYVGFLTWDSEKKLLKIKKDAIANPKEYILNYIKLHFKFETDNASIVENMKFGIPYGSSGYRDRLFLSGNPEYPNLDIHTNETGIEEENWKDYTYFGDMSYRNFGTDAQKITGYGIMNNGYMAVFKESSHSLEPNLYIRRSEITADSDGNYIESFPVSLSGISVGSDEIGQVINYGNDLLINAPKGIYKINTSESTATQTYEALEMSYYIRDNLNTDITGSCSIIFNGKLYITRKDYKGDLRVYVADQDRYSYIDNVRVYEWWVLDGINATKFYIFDNELYFTDANKGLCKLTEQYYDSYVKKIDDITINDTTLSKEVSVNTTTNFVVVSPSNEIITNIQKNENSDEGYINFRNSSKISFDTELLFIIPTDDYSLTLNSNGEYTLKYKNTNNQQYEAFLEYFSSTNWNIFVKENGVTNKFISTGSFSYLTEIINKEMITSLLINLSKVDYQGSNINDNIVIEIPANTEFDIYDLYEQYNNYPLSQCFLNSGTWYRQYEDALGNKYITEIGKRLDVYFNKLKLKLFNTLIDFDFYNQYQTCGVKFNVNQPVSCYWQSKYLSLDRLDYLKTVYSITFVPETKRGGVTNIGYRTSKSEVSFETNAEDQDFNFEFVDFNDFSFGGANMAKTYTTKKKIKNFSFIQLKMTSNDTKNSTVVALSFRYKFTRLNKGVK